MRCTRPTSSAGVRSLSSSRSSTTASPAPWTTSLPSSGRARPSSPSSTVWTARRSSPSGSDRDGPPVHRAGLARLGDARGHAARDVVEVHGQRLHQDVLAGRPTEVDLLRRPGDRPLRPARHPHARQPDHDLAAAVPSPPSASVPEQAPHLHLVPAVRTTRCPEEASPQGALDAGPVPVGEPTRGAARPRGPAGTVDRVHGAATGACHDQPEGHELVPARQLPPHRVAADPTGEFHEVDLVGIGCARRHRHGTPPSSFSPSVVAQRIRILRDRPAVDEGWSRARLVDAALPLPSGRHERRGDILTG